MLLLLLLLLPLAGSTAGGAGGSRSCTPFSADCRSSSARSVARNRSRSSRVSSSRCASSSVTLEETGRGGRAEERGGRQAGRLGGMAGGAACAGTAGRMQRHVCQLSLVIEACADHKHLHASSQLHTIDERKQQASAPGAGAMRPAGGRRQAAGWQQKRPHQEAGRRDLRIVLPRVAANHLLC